MSVKKQTNVRTGKMVRELMLADKEVTASLIMVYSKNGVNEEIKIEGLHPKSNEELFLSGKVDWNKSVIYKTVDFTGKAEVGKALLTDMKKNNVTLEIERVMWSKETQEEEEAIEAELIAAKEAEKKPAAIHTTTPPEKERTVKAEPVSPPPAPVRMETIVQKVNEPIVPPVKTETVSASSIPAAKQIAPEPVRHAAEVTAPPVRRAAEVTAPPVKRAAEVTAPPVKRAAPEEPFAPETQSELAGKYERLVSKAKGVCQDYDLGLDLDDSIESLKEELNKQGISLDFDADIMNAVRSLRELKTKGISLDKILNLV
ncbi:hypothetical protein [Ectobacillus funiculus]|uniref:Uncharacterized protein n=1 Tax=Ectobacillus funiculus TaxID=137993 RepID=A0ABV5WMJ2_9BACI